LWPELGGKAWLAPPKAIIKALGEKKSNIPGIQIADKSSPKSRRSLPKNVKGRKLSEKKK